MNKPLDILPYQLRMLQELSELRERLRALYAFVNANRENLDKDDLALLDQQNIYMTHYQGVLEIRCKRMIAECWT